MNEKINKIEALKKEKNAVIMAHYYVADEIQQLADYVGDSYYLSETATKVTADTIVPVSYTHLDVYKRQGVDQQIIVFPGEAFFAGSA